MTVQEYKLLRVDSALVPFSAGAVLVIIMENLARSKKRHSIIRRRIPTLLHSIGPIELSIDLAVCYGNIA